MFNKELFFSLCEKYNIELSDKYEKVMLRDGDEVREFKEKDVRRIMSNSQEYFLYIDSKKSVKQENIFNVFGLDDLLEAC